MPYNTVLFIKLSPDMATRTKIGYSSNTVKSSKSQSSGDMHCSQ